MHLEILFLTRILFVIKKLNLSKVIFFTYFDMEKYRAIVKNDCFQQERGSTVNELIWTTSISAREGLVIFWKASYVNEI